MKNINSKKARLEIATLINDLAFSEKATASSDNDTTETLYWMLISAQKIVKLNDVYGIPSIHYEDSLEVINNPTFTNTQKIMYERSYDYNSREA
jgi:hypothetical protein|tara:strand:- start:965 stop:1246 length:282 start_codon:yes stop_codon:yes gene_type:complete